MLSVAQRLNSGTKAASSSIPISAGNKPQVFLSNSPERSLRQTINPDTLIVVPDNFEHASKLKIPTKGICVPLSNFLDSTSPDSKDMFDALNIQKVIFSDWCFKSTEAEKKKMINFAKSLETRYKAKFGSKPKFVKRISNAVEGKLLKRGSVSSIGSTLTSNSTEIEMTSMTLVEDELFVESNQVAFTFFPIQFKFPNLKEFTFTQILHKFAEKELPVNTVEIREFAPIASFLSIMPGLHLQLTNISCLSELTRIGTQLVGLELYLGDRSYYKQYGNSLLEKHSLVPFEKTTSDVVVKTLQEAVCLETFTFIPPSGTTPQQYATIINEVNKLPKIKDVTTSHYYTKEGTTLTALESLKPAGMTRCAMNLLILDTSVEHFGSGKVTCLELPQVTSLEVHIGANWHITPKSVQQVLAPLKLPSLKHFVNETGFMGENGHFLIDRGVIDKLETFEATLKSHCRDALCNLLPIVGQGLASMKSLKRVVLKEAEFVGFNNELFGSTAENRQFALEVRIELRSFMRVICTNFLEFVRLTDAAGGGSNWSETDVDYFKENIEQLLPQPNLSNSKKHIPLELLVAAALDPMAVLMEYYGSVAWPVGTEMGRRRSKSNNTSSYNLVPRGQAYDFRMLSIVLEHCFWELIMSKLISLPDLEYVGFEQGADAGNGMMRGVQGVCFLNLPRLQILARVHSNLKQIAIPDVEFYESRRIMESSTTGESCVQQRIFSRDGGLGMYVRRRVCQEPEMFTFGQVTVSNRWRVVTVIDVKSLRRGDLEANALKARVESEREVEALLRQVVACCGNSSGYSRQIYDGRRAFESGFNGWL
ncbi:uncharacterized protein SAPINGB_P006358 [Magnusiomyces paraingens]|uniref:Uncharacterized protein n=1 Tax=Magnusiomyces paraingens TaxID=2606893 RepID=A0A5E8CBL8_9ASCO|nr:uncharacterized protein SAPINGB_P006358 [Saprochaete ingens]VVT58736.1 unnamed protein product [Saprochaete ingens]